MPYSCFWFDEIQSAYSKSSNLRCSVVEPKADPIPSNVSVRLALTLSDVLYISSARICSANTIFKMFYLKCGTLSPGRKKIAVWERQQVEHLCVCVCKRDTEHLCVHSESQMNLAASVLLKKQDIGHAQHASFYLFNLIPVGLSLFMPLYCVCCSLEWVLSVFVHFIQCCCSDWGYQSKKSPDFCFQGCMKRCFVACCCLLLSDCIFSYRFHSRVLSQSGCTLARILAKYLPLCWQSTLPHKVRVLRVSFTLWWQ